MLSPATRETPNATGTANGTAKGENLRQPGQRRATSAAMPTSSIPTRVPSRLIAKSGLVSTVKMPAALSSASNAASA